MTTDITAAEHDAIYTFALENGLGVFFGENIEFDGWLTLWPPKSQCFIGQKGWLACEVKTFGAGWHEPRDSEEEEIGEFDTLADALAALANRHESFEQWAASADTHPKDGDVEQAPLVSGAVPEGQTPKGSGQ